MAEDTNEPIEHQPTWRAGTPQADEVEAVKAGETPEPVKGEQASADSVDTDRAVKGRRRLHIEDPPVAEG